jgi:hypothetical protein
MALLSRYSKYHTARYESKPSLNLNVEPYTLPGCYDILEYYFSVSENPTWNYFAYNAEKILQAQKDKIKDNEERAERRRMAKEWLSE